jgi:acyl carrier protein
MQVREQIRHFVIDNFLFGQDTELRDGDSFLDMGIIDSTGVLELVAFLEQRFGMQISDADLVPENLDSIEKVTQFVLQKPDAALEPQHAG